MALDDFAVTALTQRDGDVEVQFEQIDELEGLTLKASPQTWLKVCHIIKTQCERSPARDFPASRYRGRA